MKTLESICSWIDSTFPLTIDRLIRLESLVWCWLADLCGQDEE